MIVDTLDTTVEPGGAGFDVTDCTDSTAGNCNYYEAVCASDRWVEFGVSGDITPDGSIKNGTANCFGSNCSVGFELSDCPDRQIRNLTIDFRTAPGAGVQIRGALHEIDGGADNVLILHPRWRGNATINYQGGTFSVTHASHVTIDHPSTAYAPAYAGNPGEPVLYGEGNEAARNISWHNGLNGMTQMWGLWTRPEQGLCFGGSNGGATLNDGGLACDTDTDCPGGVCSAYCAGGTDANERAGLNREGGHLPLAEWVFDRSSGGGVNDGVCQAGTRTGLSCAADANCTGGGAGSCRFTCGGGGVETGPFFQNAQHNFCIVAQGNTGNVSIRSNFMLGCKWRQPQITVDFGLNGLPVSAPVEPVLFDVTGNIAWGGRYIDSTATNDETAGTVDREIDTVYAYNRHVLPTDEGQLTLRDLYKDTLGDLVESWNVASVHASIGDLGSNTRMWFKGNVDRFNTDGLSNEDSYSAATPTGTAARLLLSPTGTSVHGADVDPEDGYAGSREPFYPYPAGAAPTVASLIAKVGATLPCRDAVDEYLAELVAAGVATRVMFDPAEMGGAQDLTWGCPQGYSNTAPTVTLANPTATVACGTTLAAWSGTTTNTDSKPLSLHCLVAGVGTLGVDAGGLPRGKITDKRCSGGTIAGTADISGLACGADYTFTVAASDGVWADRATGTVTIRVSP